MQVAGLLVMVAVRLRFISQANLPGRHGRFVLEGHCSGGELEDERYVCVRAFVMEWGVGGWVGGW